MSLFICEFIINNFLYFGLIIWIICRIIHLHLKIQLKINLDKIHIMSKQKGYSIIQIMKVTVHRI